MNTDSLRSLLKPPSNPVERPTPESWVPSEEYWCSLPWDYKAFVNDFGTGCIDRFIWIFNPASKNEHLNLLGQATRQLDALKDAWSSWYYRVTQSYDVIPFGTTDNGDLLVWKVAKEDRRWSIVVLAGRTPDYEEYDLTFDEFITGILGRTITCHIFPDDFPSDEPTFVPTSTNDGEDL